MADRARVPDYVLIGRILRPHGVRGMLKVMPETDDPQRFHLLKRVWLRRADGTRQEIEVDQVRVIDRSVLLSLRGITTRDAAEAWRGSEIEIPGDQLLPLAENRHYYFELIGLAVMTEDGEPIGTVKDIISYPANDVYVVMAGDREVLLPDSPDIIRSIETEKGRIVIHPLPGLLD